VIDALAWAAAVGTGPALLPPEVKKRLALVIAKTGRAFGADQVRSARRHSWAFRALRGRVLPHPQPLRARPGAAAGPAVAPANRHELAPAPRAASGAAGLSASARQGLSARIAPAPLGAVGGEGRPAVAALRALPSGATIASVVASGRPGPLLVEGGGIPGAVLRASGIEIGESSRLCAAPLGAPAPRAARGSRLPSGQVGAAVLTLHGGSQVCGSPAPWERCGAS
jgi:hypothetical protein